MCRDATRSTLGTYIEVVHELVEDADGVGAAAHARHNNVWRAAPLLLALLPRLLANDGLELADLCGDTQQRMTHKSALWALPLVGASRHDGSRVTPPPSVSVGVCPSH